MTDRLLICEFPTLIAQDDTTLGYFDKTNNYRFPNVNITPQIKTIFIYDTVIDLQGYQSQDMTAFFRQSFEQRGVAQTLQWTASIDDPLKGFNASFLEYVLVTSVPLTDSNLLAALVDVPGFPGVTTGLGTGALVTATLNREHVIHGRTYVHGIDTTLGSDVLIDAGSGYIRTVQEYDYSSLEPTAVDKLYCYRMISLPESGTTGPLATSGFTQAFVSPVRVLIDTKFDKEDTIPYFMRLKRGYELANQV